MSRWSEANVLQQDVVAAHTANPDLGATQIAHMLGCSDAYIRATARRLQLKLPRSPHGAVPSIGAQMIKARRAGRTTR